MPSADSGCTFGIWAVEETAIDVTREKVRLETGSMLFKMNWQSAVTCLYSAVKAGSVRLIASQMTEIPKFAAGGNVALQS